ncbi:MAG TPA: hypothetical protein VM686_35485 [Polyangiaceae bacterium]|nr:hypothetical protein [Polyangiaceae bacterium]
MSALLLVAATRFRGYAASLLRTFALLVVGQGLLIAAGLAGGGWRRASGYNPSDVYALTQVLILATLPAAAVVCVVELRRRPGREETKVNEFSPLGAWALSAVLGVSALVMAGPVALIFVLVVALFGRPYQVPPEAGIGTFLALASLAGLALWAVPRQKALRPGRAISAALSVVLGGSAVVSCVTVLFLSPAPKATTDRALVKSFLGGQLGRDDVARELLAELRARPASRWCTIEGALRDLRTSGEPFPSATLVGRRESYYRARNSDAGALAGPGPYTGEPELDLLEILIKRGELDEPALWRDDPRVPSELRERIAERFPTARSMP